MEPQQPQKEATVPVEALRSWQFTLWIRQGCEASGKTGRKWSFLKHITCIHRKWMLHHIADVKLSWRAEAIFKITLKYNSILYQQNVFRRNTNFYSELAFQIQLFYTVSYRKKSHPRTLQVDTRVALLGRSWLECQSWRQQREVVAPSSTCSEY